METVDDLCRVSVHAGGRQADIALPALVPLGQLIPAIHDILQCGPSPQHHSICLYPPGGGPLDPSMTLSQLGIGDGCLLFLAPIRHAPAASVVYAVDAVERTATSDMQGWTARQSRLAALVAAVVLAATTGLMAVPGRFGAPSLLLGSACAAAGAAVGVRGTRYGRTALLALVTLGTLIALASLGATLCNLSIAAAALPVAALCVLSMSGRLAVMISGLAGFVGDDLTSDTGPADDEVWRVSLRAQQVLTALVVGTSIAAAVGAIVAMGVGRRPPDYAMAGFVAGLLVLRCRSHPHPVRRATLLASGLLCTAALFVTVWVSEPTLGPWLCGAAAVMAAGVLWFGFAGVQTACAPPLRRWLDVLDCVTMLAVIPLACWSSGLYGVVRGISL